MKARGGPGAGPDSAFVLHHYDWSETSLVLDLFTRARGRVAVVAKGAKRPTSQLRAVLLPFQRIVVQLSTPRGDIGDEVLVLRSAEWAAAMALPAGDALLAGFYLNEVVMKALVRGEAQPDLFDAYGQTVAALSQASSGADSGAQAQQQAQRVAAVLRAFELVLLRQMGLLPDLARVTLTQQPFVPGRLYRLRPEDGLVAAADDDGLPGEAWAALQQALDTHAVAAVQTVAQAVAQSLGGAAGQGLKPQLRAVLHYHLGTSQWRTRQALLPLQQGMA